VRARALYTAGAELVLLLFWIALRQHTGFRTVQDLAACRAADLAGRVGGLSKKCECCSLLFLIGCRHASIIVSHARRIVQKQVRDAQALLDQQRALVMPEQDSLS